jgi:hypothetical protein
MTEKQTALTVALEQLKIAAEKLELDSGMHALLAHPKRSLIVSVAIKIQRGHKIPSKRYSRRSHGAVNVDDMEMCSRGHSIRRRKGRNNLQSEGIVKG